MINKVPYELSIWRSEHRYIIKYKGKDPITVGSLEGETDFTLINEYIQEVKIATIASSDYVAPIHAFNISFKQNVNGTNSLSFSILQHYLDDNDLKTMLVNPFIGYLVSNCHIKLKYDYLRDADGVKIIVNDEPQYQWYDLLISDISEDQKNDTFSYTCSDLHITELSKNGYNVELDTELENNINTSYQLAKNILEPTEWHVVDRDGKTLVDGRTIASDFLIAEHNEILYVYNTQSSITATVLADYEYNGQTWTKGTTVTIPANNLIYISSTCYLNKITPIHFLWCNSSAPIADADGTILNSPNYTIDSLTGYTTVPLYVSNSYRGNMLLSNSITKYLADIDTICYQYKRYEYYRPCSTTGKPKRGVAYFTKESRAGETPAYKYHVWNGDKFESGKTYYTTSLDGTPYTRTQGGTTVSVTPDGEDQLYYSYMEYEYASVSAIQQLIANNTDYADNSSWDTSMTSVYTYSTEGNYQETALKIAFGDSESGSDCFNTGIEAQKGNFKNGFVKDEAFWVAVKMAPEDSGGDSNITSAKIIGTYVEASTTVWTDFFVLDSNQPSITVTELSGYKLMRLKCVQSLSYNEMLKYRLRFTLHGKGNRLLKDCILFKEMYAENNSGTKTLIVPNLSKAINEVIKTKHNLFRQDYREYMGEIAELADIYFTTICYDTELASKGFNSLIDETYEKITGVSGSQSNYFNLIQEICEKFECWGQFVIEHGSDGRILYSYELNEDDAPISGKSYYKLRGRAPESSLFADSYYTVIPNDKFFKQQKSSDSYSRTTTYYKKLADNIYVDANLGYQYSYPPQEGYFKKTYSDGESQFTSCAGTAYDASINYYTLSRGEYVQITVSDDFHEDPTNYYTLITSGAGTGKENFNKTTVYTKVWHKYLALKKYVGRENYAGFRYGVNLNEIVRTLKSDALCTKLYVADINEDVSTNGLCSIQDATANTSGETSIYNFQYYVNTGLLSSVNLNRDLYGDSSNTGLAFLTKLGTWNKTTRELINKQTQLLITKAKIESEITTYSNLINEAKNQLERQINKIQTGMDEDETTHKQISYKKASTLKKSDAYSSYVNKAIDARDKARQTIDTNTPILLNLENQLANYTKKYRTVTLSIQDNASRKMELVTAFFRKYSQFIHEGTWKGEDQYDHDQYYSDAVGVAYTSSFPKVEYQLSATELSRLEGYESYQFNVGDKTFIEDVEFFGYIENTNTPYREEVIVSEITYCLDNPSENKITIQNYKTQFEDLFQRIAAATSSYEISKGSYQAAAAFATQPQVSTTLINRILRENSAVISNAGAQTVVMDEKGLTITDSNNPNLIMRAVGGGIVLSTDGGTSWHTGITADGFNADSLKAGTIDTSMITIWDGKYNSFQWNPDGLMAYYFTRDPDGKIVGIDPNKFVRFDENGLYASNGNTSLASHPTLSEILEYATFSLTWDGFTLRSPNITNNWTMITTKNHNIAEQVPMYETYYFKEYTQSSIDPEKQYYINLNETTLGARPRYMRISDPAQHTGSTLYTREVDTTTGRFSIFTAGTENQSSTRIPNFQILDDGTMLAAQGIFNGVVCATDIIDPQGNSMLIDGKWAGGYIGNTVAVFG